MKELLLTGFLLLLATGRLSAAPVTIEDLLGDVDTAALAEMTGVDEKQLKATARELQQQLQGKYVIPAPMRAWLAEQGVEVEPEFVILPPRLELPVPPPPLPPMAKPFWADRDRRGSWPARSQALVSRLKPVFVAEGVPPELVWLAEVESRFNPQARSRVGAVGLFQLMPDTAEFLGLATAPRDERLDPEKNARAGARYLRYLYTKFRNWRLAVAAYNGGEGRVRRLLEKRAGQTLEDIATGLPTETRIYVLRVEAAVLTYEGALLSELPPAGGVSSSLGRR
jgi:membrane-bound lytic murein transglycosylase D